MGIGSAFKLTQGPAARGEAAHEALAADGVAFYELVIIGGGPAGLTAAIYAGRAAIRTLVLLGPAPGGQLVNTDVVENFPGFPDGIRGPELAQRLQDQAERFGAQMVVDSVTRVDLSTSPFVLHTHSRIYRARAVIVATGAVPRLLGVPGEETYFGRGVSTCATCDGFFYRGKKVVVVGGGDSAVDEGLVLAKFADRVMIVHRRDELRATKIYQERAFAHPRIYFVWDTVVEEILGAETVTGVRVRNVKTGETSVIDTDGVFIYIGTDPRTEIFEGHLELDAWGYIVTDKRMSTSVPGVFAAGDVQDHLHRQVVVAAGTGAIAAMEAEKFLGAYPRSEVAQQRQDREGEATP
jgi:thioredoxin reductase (NADPH)